MTRFARIALAASALTLAAGTAPAAENRTIFSFDGTNGSYPIGMVADPSGVLYGTTYNGGISNKNCRYGCGTIFQLLLPPAGPGMPWHGKLLHSFSGTDGSFPEATPIVDSHGNIFGTTYNGGTADFGVVWELSPITDGGWTYSVLHDFSIPDGSDDGGYAGAIVMSSAGIIYGVTQYGGSSQNGSVYSLAPPAQPGRVWTETILHSFTPQ